MDSQLKFNSIFKDDAIRDKSVSKGSPVTPQEVDKTDCLQTVCQQESSPLPSSSSKNKKECPCNKSELGRHTWSFLHTTTIYYPLHPSTED